MTTRRDFLGALPGIPAGLPLIQAQPRDLQQSRSGSCDVATFGATGDGVTEDTDAVRAAIAACSPNGHLVFPPGRRYRIGQVEIRKNLVVDARGATLVLAGPNAGFGVHGTIDFFRVLGGTIVGSGRAQDFQIGWLFGDLDDDQISNVSVDGLTAVDCAIGVKVAGTRQTPVRHLTLRDSRLLHATGLEPGMGYGALFHQADFSKAIGCHFENCERHALYFGQGRNYVAMGNTFHHHRRDVAAQVIRPALVIARSESVSVVGNVFDGCLDGAASVETDPQGRACRNVTICANTFLNSHPFDLLVGNDDPATHGYPEHLVIIANTFSRDADVPAGTALDVRCVAYVTVSQNSFLHQASGSGGPTGVYLRGTGGDQFTNHVELHHNLFRYSASAGQAYAVEIGPPIAQGSSTVKIRDNTDHTSGGVHLHAAQRNRNLLIQR